MTQDEILYYGWSQHIHNNFLQSKSVINSTLSKLWVPTHKLRSGQNVPAMHQVIRRYWYYQWSLNAAKIYVTTKIAERNKAGLAVLSEVESEALRSERLKVNMDKFNLNSLNSYPDEWLAFLFLGKPDFLQLGTMSTFNVGKSVDADVIDATGSTKSVTNMSVHGSNIPVGEGMIMPKEVRKHAQSLQLYSQSKNNEMGESMVPSSKKQKVSANPSEITVTHRHAHLVKFDGHPAEFQDSTITTRVSALSSHPNVVDLATSVDVKKNEIDMGLKYIADQKMCLLQTIERCKEFKAPEDIILAKHHEMMKWEKKERKLRELVLKLLNIESDSSSWFDDDCHRKSKSDGVSGDY